MTIFHRQLTKEKDEANETYKKMPILDSTSLSAGT